MPESAVPVLCWVEIRPVPGKAGHAAISAHVAGLSASSGRFSLRVAKGGKAGRTDTKQGGAFEIGAGESKILSTTAVNIRPAESLAVELTVDTAGGTVCRAAVRAPDSGHGREI